MLLPWMGFYAFFIPGLIGVSVANAVLQEDYTYKFYSIIPVSIAFVYLCLWISVLRLYKSSQRKTNVTMKAFGAIFLQPLTTKVSAYVEEAEEQADTLQKEK